MGAARLSDRVVFVKSLQRMREGREDQLARCVEHWSCPVRWGVHLLRPWSVPDAAAACLANRNLLTANCHRYAYDSVVSEIEDRVARWTHLPRENQEPLEVG